MVSGLAHNRDNGTAGSFHRKPLYTTEISRLGDVFKAGDVGIIVNGATAWLFASGRKGDLNIRGGSCT
jgi:hypothetical protein